ncbi:hypothetical protein [Chitinophaga sp. Cy-1792]|uniref:hypothetical protein n=1 Tax=Chitinophaga sp. Cy-1792 TaxID=2608339 RepID=UPI0014244FC9|nr:hypothetical protein [Chitinophaga sp. Cy-1792]NIG53859.1 hypothetical protein [Chitinophaga sp. Cy-1792]
MGYVLHAFVCKQPVADIMVARFKEAIRVDLRQGVALIPMTEALCDEIGQEVDSPRVGNFTYLNEKIEAKVLETIGEQVMAYLEADYFGGEGGQMVICWEDKKRILSMFDVVHGQINVVLQKLEVERGDAYDEFAAVDLGRHRSMEEWVND